MSLIQATSVVQPRSAAASPSKYGAGKDAAQDPVGRENQPGSAQKIMRQIKIVAHAKAESMYPLEKQE
jgi:hypothetical protein